MRVLNGCDHRLRTGNLVMISPEHWHSFWYYFKTLKDSQGRQHIERWFSLSTPLSPHMFLCLGEERLVGVELDTYGLSISCTKLFHLETQRVFYLEHGRGKVSELKEANETT